MSASIIGCATFWASCLPLLATVAFAVRPMEPEERLMARIACAGVATVPAAGLAYCIARIAGLHS